MKSLFAALLLLIFSTSFAQIYETAKDVKPLLIGETIPNAKLLNMEGNSFNFSNNLERKPTVLIFYRGGWCPYCNAQLSDIAKMEDEIIKAGYQIIAISPEDFTNFPEIVKKDEVKFQLLSDVEGKLIEQMGIGFRPDEKTKEYISKKTTGKNSTILPVASVFVVNMKKEIVFEYVNPNYKQRLSGNLLLAVLKNLKQ